MNRVFVLGSGFSTYAGAPVSRGVLPAIFAPERQDHSILDLHRYLTKFLFKGQRDWVYQSGLEEVLSRLDLIRHYQPYPNTDYTQVTIYEERLLEEFIRLLTPQKVNSAHNVYFRFGRLINPNDKIISFNYDLITEELLRSLGMDYSYHLNLEEAIKKEPADYKGRTTVPLLKLHGSVNLYYCAECAQISEFIPLAQQAPLCTTCSAKNKEVPLRHFIIAPTLFKSYTLPPLRQLWFQALQALSAADQIIFIGYSLPKADILSYQLFDFGRKLATKEQVVLLVNGCRHIPDRFEQLYDSCLRNTRLYLDEWLQASK